MGGLWQRRTFWRSPTLVFAIAVGVVGLFDTIGSEHLEAVLKMLLGEAPAGRVMLLVGVVIPALRFLSFSPLFERWRHEETKVTPGDP